MSTILGIIKFFSDVLSLVKMFKDTPLEKHEELRKRIDEAFKSTNVDGIADIINSDK